MAVTRDEGSMNYQCEECGAPVDAKWTPCADCRGENGATRSLNATPGHGQGSVEKRPANGLVVES